MGNYFGNNPYLTPYHTLNTIGILLYPVYRTTRNNLTGETLTGNREYQILFTVFLIATVKFFKSISWEEWIHHLFVYGKTAVALLFIFQDYRLGIWYVIFCLLVWIFVRMPHYTGPDKFQEIYSEDHFYDVLMEYKNKSLPKGVDIKLFLFYADWSDPCLYTERIWANLSMRYTNQFIHFYKIDATALEKLAKKHNVSTEVGAHQLPTIIMFENAKETGRFPPALKPGIKVAGPASYTERNIVRYLELDSKFYATSAK